MPPMCGLSGLIPRTKNNVHTSNSYRGSKCGREVWTLKNARFL